MVNLTSARIAVSGLLGLALTLQGLRATLQPVAQSSIYGVPISPTDKEAASFVSAMGARNLAFGLSIGGLLYRGHAPAVGVVMLSAVAIEVVDTWICWRSGGGEMTASAWSHAGALPVVGGLGWWLMG